MVDTAEATGISKTIGDAVDWASDVASTAWQGVRNHPWETLGTVAVLGAMGGAGALRALGYGGKMMARNAMLAEAEANLAAGEVNGGMRIGGNSGALARDADRWLDFPASTGASRELNSYLKSLPTMALPARIAAAGEPLSALNLARPLQIAESSPTARTLNTGRMPTLFEVNARAQTPLDQYRAFLADRTTVKQIDEFTQIAKLDGYKITLRADENLSFRFKSGTLEVVDHQMNSARIYTSNPLVDGNRGMAVIRTEMGRPVVKPGGVQALPSDTVSSTFVPQVEKTDLLKKWLFTSRDGKDILKEFDKLR